MNKEQFDNLKIGDKVVLARIKDTTSSRYSSDITRYLNAQGRVTRKYWHGLERCESGIRIKFSNGCEWFYNVEDVELVNESEKETNMQQTKTPHRHAAIIKAWADGEEIEFLSSSGKWIVVGDIPSWGFDNYRIKPKFEKRYKYAYPGGSEWYISSWYYKDDASFLAESGYIGTVFEKIEASGKDFQIN